MVQNLTGKHPIKGLLIAKAVQFQIHAPECVP
jgi:hypothetical protein